MTAAPSAAGQPGDADLTARISAPSTRNTACARSTAPTSPCPKGTRWFVGHSLGEIARQISDHDHPGPAASPVGPGQIVATTSSAGSFITGLVQMSGTMQSV